jgi:hypothetical protein
MSAFGSGALTLSEIFTAFGITDRKMSNLVGRQLFNDNGSTYNIPAASSGAPLKLTYFRGRYHTNPRPYIAPKAFELTAKSNSSDEQEIKILSITPPSGFRTPTSIQLELWGAGGGGAGGGGGSYSGGNNKSGGGGGGGGGGAYIRAVFSYTGQIITLRPGRGGTGGGGGGGNGSCCGACAGNGGDGGDGESTTVTIGNITITANGGRGGWHGWNRACTFEVGNGGIGRTGAGRDDLPIGALIGITWDQVYSEPGNSGTNGGRGSDGKYYDNEGGGGGEGGRGGGYSEIAKWGTGGSGGTGGKTREGSYYGGTSGAGYGTFYRAWWGAVKYTWYYD